MKPEDKEGRNGRSSFLLTLRLDRNSMERFSQDMLNHVEAIATRFRHDVFVNMDLVLMASCCGLLLGFVLLIPALVPLRVILLVIFICFSGCVAAYRAYELHVEPHGIVALLPEQVATVLVNEDVCLLDILRALMRSGGLAFYFWRLCLLVCCGPTTDEELEAILDGCNPTFLRILTTRGLHTLLPHRLRRILQPVRVQRTQSLSNPPLITPVTPSALLQPPLAMPSVLYRSRYGRCGGTGESPWSPAKQKAADLEKSIRKQDNSKRHADEKKHEVNQRSDDLEVLAANLTQNAIGVTLPSTSEPTESSSPHIFPLAMRFFLSRALGEGNSQIDEILRLAKRRVLYAALAFTAWSLLNRIRLVRRQTRQLPVAPVVGVSASLYLLFLIWKERGKREDATGGSTTPRLKTTRREPNLEMCWRNTGSFFQRHFFPWGSRDVCS